MAEQRKKTSSILLATEGKIISIELYDAMLWPEHSSREGLSRVRIDGKWYCPHGKYSFLTLGAVGELLTDLQTGEDVFALEERPNLCMRQRVNVLHGDCVGGLPIQKRRATIIAPPWRGADGCWHVFVSTSDGFVREVPCRDVETY